MEFGGMTIWITGASSGIGAALARAFGAAGAHLILSGRREDALASVAGALGGEAFVLPFEATDMGALPGVVARAWDWHGGIDVLVNNAGISQRSLAIDTTMDVYRRIMEVDFFAPVALSQLVVPRMIARGSGHIVAVSSVAGKVGSPLRSGYCAAKHALIGYCDALRAECETAYGIGVTSILPGSVRTAIATNALLGDGAVRGVSDTNIDNGMDPEEVATADTGWFACWGARDCHRRGRRGCGRAFACNAARYIVRRPGAGGCAAGAGAQRGREHRSGGGEWDHQVSSEEMTHPTSQSFRQSCGLGPT